MVYTQILYINLFNSLQILYVCTFPNNLQEAIDTLYEMLGVLIEYLKFLVLILNWNQITHIIKTFEHCLEKRSNYIIFIQLKCLCLIFDIFIERPFSTFSNFENIEIKITKYAKIFYRMTFLCFIHYCGSPAAKQFYAYATSNISEDTFFAPFHDT